MIRRPPPGIASRALMARLRTRVFELIGVGQGRPHVLAQRDLKLDSARPALRRSRSSMPSIRRLTSTGRGSSGWRRANASSRWVRRRRAIGGGQGRIHEPLDILISAGLDPPLHDVHRADDAGQQIVEVVRDAAGQLADRLHLLRLAQRLLGLRNASSASRSAVTSRPTACSKSSAATALQAIYAAASGARAQAQFERRGDARTGQFPQHGLELRPVLVDNEIDEICADQLGLVPAKQSCSTPDWWR